MKIKDFKQRRCEMSAFGRLNLAIPSTGLVRKRPSGALCNSIAKGPQNKHFHTKIEKAHWEFPEFTIWPVRAWLYLQHTFQAGIATLQILSLHMIIIKNGDVNRVIAVQASNSVSVVITESNTNNTLYGQQLPSPNFDRFSRWFR